MDTLTHTVLGACLGEMTAGKKIGRKAMLIGALANNFPDIDAICYLWMDPTQALLAHRGFTHGIIFNVILSLLLASSFQTIWRSWQLNYGQWLLLLGGGLLSHVLLDTFNAYGTGLLEPFSHERYSLNALYILDPFFTTPMLIASLALLFVRAASLNRKVWPKLGLTLSMLYLLLCGVNKLYVNNITEKSLRWQGIAARDYFVTPTPLNNLLWYIVVKDKNQYHVGYYSVLDQHLPPLHLIPQNDSLLEPYRESKTVQNLVRFSQDYYMLQEEGDMLLFNDMRFGQESGWIIPQAPYVFSFDIRQEKPHMLRVQQNRFKTFHRKSIVALYSRIKGKED
jgi:inner membrane protein